MELVTFQRFRKKEDALFLSKALREQGIESLIDDYNGSLDASLGNSSHAIEYGLKINKTDFKKAIQIFNEISAKELEEVDPNYFLFEFSEEELHEVVVKKDEWGDFNFALALRILKDRGAEITPEQLQVLHNERLAELAKPEDKQTSMVIAGYIFAFLGGLLGALTGWYLMTLKKTLPNGERVYSYLPADRKHGKRIFIIGICFTTLFVIIRIIEKMKSFE